MANKFTSWIAEKIGNTAGEIVTSVGETVDRFVHTGEEKAEFELLQREIDLKFKNLRMEMEEAYLKDRQSAREMYAQDSFSQKILTILFTMGFFALSGFMLFWLLNKLNLEMSDFTIFFISSMFGAFNAIMVQIISFYFGSSQGGEDTGKAISRSFNQAAQHKESGGR